jgi:hypothetical protein
MKKALVIGIDDYASPNELSGCVNDAVEISAMLEKHGDGSPNFTVRRLLSNDETVTCEKMHDKIIELFSGDAEVAVLYFAGHGIVNDNTNAGHIIATDGRHPNWGIALSEIIQLANDAYPKITSSVIILDSCQSGHLGQSAMANKGGGVPSTIGDGVTILTACHRDQQATEDGGHGKFTSILLDGMSGAASDILGRVTPAALYAYVDQTIGDWGQRPIYKANVQKFITLREVPPKIEKSILRNLPTYFPTSAQVFKLDPSYEPQRGEEAERLKHIPVDENNARVFKELQKCSYVGLVKPTEHQHMWHSAIQHGGCKLTATGVHYRFLAKNNKI